MHDQTAKLEWREDKIPVSTQFDDPYFSLDNGLNETRHVFLSGNNLPARFAPGFHIAELGFGTGLNLLAVWRAWEASGQTTPLRFTSFEAFPMSAEEMARALAAFPEVADYAERLVHAWAQDPTLATLDGIKAQIILGDARERLPHQDWSADAWFLDGFRPSSNPEMWTDRVFEQVARLSHVGTTFATFTSAGFVRRGLAGVGFEVNKVPGFGRKREMSVGVMA